MGIRPARPAVLGDEVRNSIFANIADVSETALSEGEEANARPEWGCPPHIYN